MLTDTELRERLATVVTRYRAYAGISRADLADMVGVSERTVKAWELGEKWPGPAALAALSDVGVLSVPQLRELFRSNNDPLIRR